MNDEGRPGSRSRRQHGMLVAMLGCVALLVGGCSSGSRMGVYTINVHTPGIEGQNFDVDMVGVAAVDRDKWANMTAGKVASYFSGNSPTRNDASKKTLMFDQAAQKNLMLEADDEIWARWKGSNAMYVAVLTNALFAEPGEDNGVNRPPLIVPLDARRWKGKVIDVQFLSGRLAFRVAPDPAPAD